METILVSEIENIVRENPNDSDLGLAIRKLVRKHRQTTTNNGK